MSRKNVLAIDAGSSSIRGTIVDSELNVVETWSVPLIASTPAPNFVEYSGEAIAAALVEILSRATSSCADISAMAITNQRATTALWDAQTGKVLGPVLSWMDLRTAAMCLGLASSGISIAPNQSATKVAFLASIATGSAAEQMRFGTLDSYLLWLLTDGQSHATDHTNAAMTGFVQDTSVRWDPKVTDVLSLPRTILPEILPSASYFGEYRGQAAIPILGMIGDQQGSLLGQGCLAIGDTKITFGTGTILDQNAGRVAPKEVTRGASGMIPIVAYSDQTALTWAREGIALASGSMINWLLSMKILPEIARANQIDSSFRSGSRLYVIPANVGLGTPEWDFGARSLMVGLSLSTTATDIVAATLDAIAQIAADLVEAVQADTGLEINTLAVDGGMTANDPFLHLVADALGIPIVVAPNRESATIGAALLAHGQLGGYRAIGEHGLTIPAGRRVAPRIERGSALWQSRREAWKEAKALSLASLPEFSAVKF